jgi:fucose 4-O-acetylase-like acetyltransferase
LRGARILLLTRDAYFDNIKFILITLVVIGHLIMPLSLGQTVRAIVLTIYAFHMPLFIFISGYFSKNYKSKDYGKKIFTNLIIPYLIFETLYSLFDYLLINTNSIVFSYFTPYWIMWYLFSMIIWKLILPYVANLKKSIALLISFTFSILIGYAEDAGYYASISRTIAFFPFFLMGFYFKKEYLNYFRSRKYKISSVVIICLIFYLFYGYASTLKTEFLFHAVPYSVLEYSGIYGAIYRIISFIFAIILGMCVMIIVPKKQIPILSKLGRNTIYAYLLHGFIISYIYANSSSFYPYFDTDLKKIGLILIGCLIAIILSTDIVKLLFKWIIEPRFDFIKKKQMQ